MKDFNAFKDRLTTISREAFTLKYMKILSLLYVPVKKDVITTLAQFYDPPPIRFLFRNIQLDPTLEEFGKVLYFPNKNKGPYRGLG